MTGIVGEQKCVLLMGPPRVTVQNTIVDQGVKITHPISNDSEAMQLLALLILAREFLSEEGVVTEDGEVRREWLLTRLHLDLIAKDPQQARDKMAFALKKLEKNLKIRRNDGALRERKVIAITLKDLSIDVLEIVTAAKQIHFLANQEKVIALGERRLLEDIPYPWLEEPPFQRLIALLDDHYLSALALMAESQIVQMDNANQLGMLEDASACRSRALFWLDKAAVRLRKLPQHPRAQEFVTLQNRLAWSLPLSAHNIPRPVTRFIGRETEKSDLKALLSSDRLVTVAGMGGCGKTRLALEAAAEFLNDGRSDAWLVELAGIDDPALVPQAVASVVGITERPGQTLVQALTARFRQKPTLLLLDNCEHLLEASAALIEALIPFCPALKILATSRHLLNIYGEYPYHLSPLNFPENDQIFLEAADPVAALLGYEAAQLFLDRVRPYWAAVMDLSHVLAIAAICKSLDGIPFALEIAASCVKVMSLAEVAAMLTDRFSLPSGGRRKGLSPHHTLRETIDWSYNLLTPPEQTLLNRLSVFAGGWTLQAARSVCVSADILEAEILDILTSLVNKSLITAWSEQSSVRYSLLETVRQYASESLKKRGEWDEIRSQHRAYYLRLAQEAEPNINGPAPKPWLDRLETEIGNLRTALEWRADEEALCLASALQRFWVVQGYLQEGRQWLEREMHAGKPVSASVRASAMIGAGTLATLQGKIQEAERLYEKSQAIWNGIGDKRGMATALCRLGDIAGFQGEYAKAEIKYHESQALFTALKDTGGLAEALSGLGKSAHNQFQFTEAREKMQAGLTLLREQGDALKIADALLILGKVATYQKDYHEARLFLEESLAVQRQMGNRQRIAAIFTCLGDLARNEGNDTEARSFLEASLELMQQTGDRWGSAMALSTLTIIDYEQGEFEKAWVRGEQSLELFQEIGNERLIAAALSNLGGVARKLGKLNESGKLLRESLAKISALQETAWVSTTLEELSWLAAEQREHAHAVKLLAAASRLQELTAIPRTPQDDARHTEAVSQGRTALGEEEFSRLWAEGQAMTEEEAVTYALAEC